MLRPLRLLLAIAIIAGSVVLAAASIYELTRTGTCGATGGAVAIRECPEGTGSQVLLLILGIFVIPFAGIGIAPTARLALGGLWWCFVWIAMGSAAFVAGYGPAAPDGAKDGALGVGITFLAIGGLSLIGVVISLLTLHGSAQARAQAQATLDDRARKKRQKEQQKKRPPQPGPTPIPTRESPPMETLAQQLQQVAKARAETEQDPLARRLRKLEDLRRAGLITDAEHAARRQEILDEV